MRHGVGTLFAISIFVMTMGAPCTRNDPPPTPANHPFVLAHGALGMESYGPLDYWYGIEDYIEDKGGTVYVTEVSAANSSSAARCRSRRARRWIRSSSG